MHLFLHIIGLIFIVSTNPVNSLPRIDPIAYHQSIFRYSTSAPKQNAAIQQDKTTPSTVENDAKSDPLQLFMRFFNNTPFMKNLGSMFERPKQRLQAAPKIQKHNIINITKFAGQQTLQQNDEPLNYSIDEAPQVKDQPSQIGNFEWKNVLLGPSGLLTTIFNEFKERHKMDAFKVKPNIPQADLTPEQNDFAKLFESFLQKAKSGNFDEPLPELPFIGICNRISCGDIYKAVDEFRKSEFFSNFQTAISLLHDPKGLDIIGEVLANPELIENYVGKQGGSSLPDVVKTAGIKATKDELIEDADLGVDLSAVEDGKPIEIIKKIGKEMPVISSNLDYYSSVDTDVGKVEKEEKIPDHIDVEEIPKTANFTVPALPQISESIDAVPEDYLVAVEETISIPKQTEEVLKSSIKPITTTTIRPTTTTSLYTTTRKNFRVKDPYYDFYYDT